MPLTINMKPYNFKSSFIALSLQVFFQKHSANLCDITNKFNRLDTKTLDPCSLHKVLQSFPVTCFDRIAVWTMQHLVKNGVTFTFSGHCKPVRISGTHPALKKHLSVGT
jgi:hypothetical protein